MMNKTKLDVIPLDSKAVENIDLEKYKCPVCCSKGRPGKFRYFIINYEDEILKCESNDCMFPYENIICRKRNTNEYFRYAEQKSTQNGNDVELDFLLDTFTDPIPSQPNSKEGNSFEEILDDLFPDEITEPVQFRLDLLNSPKGKKLIKEVKVQSPEKKTLKLKKCLELVQKPAFKKIVDYKTKKVDVKQPKLSPLDLVKQCIAAKKKGIKMELKKEDIISKKNDK